MLPRCTSHVCHVFVLVLCLSSAEDFDWTKNDHGSFYYGSFPAGKHLLCRTWSTRPGPPRALTCPAVMIVHPCDRPMGSVFIVVALTVWSLFRQDFRGVPAVPPIRQKEPGTKMEKD